MALPSCAASTNPCLPKGIMYNGTCQDCGMGYTPQCKCETVGGELVCSWYCGFPEEQEEGDPMKMTGTRWVLFLLVLAFIAFLVYNK